MLGNAIVAATEAILTIAPPLPADPPGRIAGEPGRDLDHVPAHWRAVLLGQQQPAIIRHRDDAHDAADAPAGRVLPTFFPHQPDGSTLTHTYNQQAMAQGNAERNKKFDQWFINDQYWLLFPLHVAWDSGADVEDAGMHKLPLGKGSAERIVVKYPSDGGYTPGDTWELYVGPDNLVQQFIYHRGGSKKPSLVVTTWAGYKKAGPLLVSTDHRGTADGKPLRVSISGISVKVTGSDTWTNAQ